MIAKMAWIRRQEQENSTCSDSECYEDLHAVGEDYLEAVLLLNRQKVTCAVLILLIFGAFKTYHYEYGYTFM